MDWNGMRGCQQVEGKVPAFSYIGNAFPHMERVSIDIYFYAHDATAHSQQPTATTRSKQHAANSKQQTATDKI
jgi:hypothetical protein